MKRPWNPEREVSIDLATRLIEEQFPELVPVRVEVLGVGWDNIAFRVGARSGAEDWVFRFPRREMGVELMRTESGLLPAIAPHLSLPIPVPACVGQPGDGYPWPFAGYRMLSGETACRADLDLARRAQAAAPLAEFLASLHSVPAELAREHGAPGDTLGRLEPERRVPQIEERLGESVRHGLIASQDPWRWIIDQTPLDWVPGGSHLVHGDFYARHVLVDEEGRPAGVIDWGDVHIGDPAVDLSIAHGFLPPAAREQFRERYGPIDPAAWKMARLKALHSAAMILAYGHDVDDRALVREGLCALAHLATRD